MIRINSAIQSALLLAINQSESKALKIRALTIEATSSYATFLSNQASSFAQNASLLASYQVPQQLSLLNDMISLANSTDESVSKFKASKSIANGTQQAVSFSQSQVSTVWDSLNAINNVLLLLTETETQIQTLQVIVNQTIAYTPDSVAFIAQLIQIVTDMESAARSMSNALNSTILAAKAAKEAAVQVDLLQAIALQAAIKAARLALCYPNPCLNGGMCAASPDNSSFTCFCSSLYKGNTCQYLKVTSVFNAGKGFSNYESLIRVDEDQKGLM